ncbi:hypothetical protein LCGC14_1556130 [marine sediment metagenome]|uniref:Uncharacterized protein n=1 Tax=marine sediment metagenome TaxID=412755 RepID=A0A0F9INW4_9ZZZZ
MSNSGILAKATLSVQEVNANSNMNYPVVKYLAYQTNDKKKGDSVFKNKAKVGREILYSLLDEGFFDHPFDVAIVALKYDLDRLPKNRKQE